MRLRKRERLRQSIKRSRGEIELVCGLFFLVFLMIFLQIQLELYRFATSALYLEDALAASNLASAIIDVEEYGRSHQILIQNPAEAYEVFRQAIQQNLNLNAQWECENKEIIASTVSVECYIVYNVQEKTVTSYRMCQNGGYQVEQGSLGEVYAPNGQAVEKTGIYSEITYDIYGLSAVKLRAHKGKLVDIVASDV